MNEPLYLLDVNLLVAMTLRDHVQHRIARQWFDTLQPASWATCSYTEMGFARICLNGDVTGRTIIWSSILAMLTKFRTLPGHRLIQDNLDLLSSPVVTRAPVFGHRQVSDLYLAALAARNSAVLATLDRGVVEGLHPEDRSFVHLVRS